MITELEENPAANPEGAELSTFRGLSRKPTTLITIANTKSTVMIYPLFFVIDSFILLFVDFLDLSFKLYFHYPFQIS